MATTITDLKGMNADLAERLKGQGIKHSDQLLEATAAPAQRKALAKQLEMNERALLELANRADLSRIKGVAGVFSDLLEQAGVDTVKELAARRADNLHAKILEVNQAKGLTKRPPTMEMVSSWVDQAKELPKLLSY